MRREALLPAGGHRAAARHLTDDIALARGLAGAAGASRLMAAAG